MLYWRYCKDHINLYKTLMFIRMQKTHFIIHFFLDILHFKEFCNLIGWQHRELEFCQIQDWWWNINNNISFHFRLYTRKTNDKVFLKSQKNVFWDHFGPFLPKFGQKWIFLEIRVLSVFRYSNYLSLCQKFEKTVEQFLRKTPNWRTDRWWWFYKTLCSKFLEIICYYIRKIVQNLTSLPPLSM